MKTKNKYLLFASVLLLTSFGVSAVSHADFSKWGSAILSKTGVVSGSQADAIFKAGEKLSKAAESVTDEQEYYLGRSVSAVILSRYKVLHNSSATHYANKIAEVLVAYSTRPETFGGYHVAILDTPQVNAVSAPGGFIFISSGFLSLLDSEDELASVIAHEIAHVALKHGTSAISESNLTDALSIVGKEAASSTGNTYVNELNALFSESVNEVVDTLLDKGYSRSQEYDADEYAVTLLTKSGYNPAALVKSLKKLDMAAKQESGWFETHPSAGNRIGEISGAASKADSITAEETRRTERYKKDVKL